MFRHSFSQPEALIAPACQSSYSLTCVLMGPSTGFNKREQHSIKGRLPAYNAIAP